jgi:hypothetical protein
MRRPLYGGERGVRKRSEGINTQFRVFAKSDFKHDFGEGIDTRDKYTSTDLQRFVEIAQRFNLSKTNALITGFNNVIGNNPYTLLKSTISSIYPEQVINDREFLNEENVLEIEGINYPNLKLAIQTDKKTRTRTEELRFTDPIRINYPVRGDDEDRNYLVSAVPMKIKGETANIASSFYHLSQKKTKFAIIIDAAGGLSLTSIKKKLVQLIPSEKFEFYIIENIENDSDSATKLKHIDKEDGSNVEIFYLRDQNQSVIYPPFNPIQGSDQAENLYGNARLILSRSGGGETEADFIYPNNEQYHIPNVSQNANVKNASLNLLAAKVANREREAHLYPYLKRVGDWCQALSLLDTSRVYDILNENHDPTGKSVTLEQLENKDFEVALVTLDRILLAYALKIGINVFFTSGSDITSLMYFKNTEIQLSPEKLVERINELIQQYNDLKSSFQVSTIVNDLNTLVPAFVATENDIDYLRRLRSLLSNVSMMRFEFDTLANLIKEKDDLINQEKTYGPILKQLLTDGVSFIKKYLADNTHNQILLNSIKEGTYPDFPEESEYYTLLAGNRPNRRAITNMKTIISTKMYSDAEQVKEIFDRIGITRFRELLRPATTLGDVFKGFSAYPLIYNTQRGGGKVEIDTIYESLLTFEVTPVLRKDIDNFVRSTDTPQPVISSFSEEPGLARRFMYRGESMEPYTVCDNFIVTNEKIVLIPIIASQITQDVDQSKLNYSVTRLLILYNDILYSRYESLSTNEEIIPFLDEESRVLGYVESDVNFIEHKRLHVETEFLFDIVSGLKSTNNFINAIGLASQLMTNREKWTNNTVILYTEDRYAVRNNDFTRTFARIREIQDMLLKYFSPPQPMNFGMTAGRRSLYG